MTERKYDNADFLIAVAALRRLSPFQRSVAFHASNFWNEPDFTAKVEAAYPAVDMPQQGTMQ